MIAKASGIRSASKLGEPAQNLAQNLAHFICTYKISYTSMTETMHGSKALAI